MAAELGVALEAGLTRADGSVVDDLAQSVGSAVARLHALPVYTSLVFAAVVVGGAGALNLYCKKIIKFSNLYLI